MKIYSNVWSVQQLLSRRIVLSSKAGIKDNILAKKSFSSQHVQLSPCFQFCTLSEQKVAQSWLQDPPRWEEAVDDDCRSRRVADCLPSKSTSPSARFNTGGNQLSRDLMDANFAWLFPLTSFLPKHSKLQIMWFVISDLTDPFSYRLIIHQKEALWSIISKSWLLQCVSYGELE